MMISKALVMLMIATMTMSRMMTTTFLSNNSNQAKISGNRSRTLKERRCDGQVFTVHQIVHGGQVIEPVEGHLEAAAVLGMTSAAAAPLHVDQVEFRSWSSRSETTSLHAHTAVSGMVFSASLTIIVIMVSLVHHIDGMLGPLPRRSVPGHSYVYSPITAERQSLRFRVQRTAWCHQR
jgi:hypothetical protein